MSTRVTSLRTKLIALMAGLLPMADALAQGVPVPEPESWLLVGIGLVAVIAVTLKRRK